MSTFMSRFLFMSLAVVLASGPTEPAPAQPADSVAITDSLEAALQQFERAEPPTPPDSARLRRWSDSLVVESVNAQKNGRPGEGRLIVKPALRGYRTLNDTIGIANAEKEIGTTYAYQARFDEALTHWRKALDIFREAGNRKEAVLTLQNIGVAYEKKGQYDEALTQYQEALETYRQLGDQAGVASVLINIGAAHMRQSRLDEALARWREALELKREIGDRNGIANALGNIAAVYESKARYETALLQYQKALEIHRETDNQRKAAQWLNNIGVLLENQGQYDRALVHYKKALEIYRRIAARRNAATALMNIGEVYSKQGRLEKGLDHYEEAREIHQNVGDRNGVATTMSKIASIRLDQGRHEEALALHQEALSIFRKIGNRESIAGQLGSIGAVYLSQGRLDDALTRYRKSLSIYRELEIPKGRTAVLAAIGDIHLQQGQLPAATDTLRRVVRLAERLRLRTTSPEARRTLLADQIKAYRALTDAHIRAERPDSALKSAEKAQARLLADRLAGTARADSAFTIPRIPELQRSLGSSEVALLYVGIGTRRPLRALAVTRDSVYARSLPGSAVRESVAEAHPVRLNRLRRKEGPLKAALGQSRSRELGTPPSLAEIIRLYRHQLTREQAGTSIQNDLSERLYRLLVEPIADVITDKSEVIAVPTGALGYLPFETLQDDSERYLVERKRVRYAQSLTVLRQLQQRDYTGRKRPLLAFGGATYEPNPEGESSALVAEARGGSTRVATGEHASTLRRDAERRMKQGKSPRPTYQQLGYARWSDLPGTQSEVQKLGQIAGDGTTIMTGGGASEDSVRALDERSQLRTYRRIHFATHGVAMPETPQLSALVLSQVGTSDSLAARDGYLTMEEIAGLHLRADVAVLSACQTGLGKIVAGEGVVSLSHAFLRAGANATLVSQWKVLDESTRQFMTAVYRRAKGEDTSFAEAVTETKRAFIDGEYGKKNTDPLRWAPFAYYGRE